MKRIPYSRQTIGSDDVREVTKTLRSDFLTQGPKVAEFERAIARYCNTKYAVAFSSGTTALHAAYFAAGIKKGDEVVMPALTFAATGNAALYLDAAPVFADIDPRTRNIDVKDAARKITRRTKAIVAVDYAGVPADLAALRTLAKKSRLVFIEDGAQALGARYRGTRVGAIADMTMFSFHPVKSITTGEGGIITTNSKDYYEKMMLFRTHGITRDPKYVENTSNAAWHQEMHLLGNNYRLTDIHAALGVSQMRKLEKFLAARRKLAARYFKLLADIEGIELPPDDIGASAWHLFPIRIRSQKPRARDRVFNELRAKGIGVQVHYLPVYLHPYYRKLGYTKGLCPETEAFAAAELSLPLYPTLSKRDQEFVVQKLTKALERL